MTSSPQHSDCSADIAIVDEREIVFEGLRSQLHRPASLQVVGRASSGPEAVQLVTAHRHGNRDGLRVDGEPGARGHSERSLVVILHAALPGEDAFGLANRLRVSRPPLRIVLLVTEIPRDLRRRADIAGVNGIIALRDTTEAVVLAVRSALGGRQFISQTVLDWVAADIASSRGSVSAGAHRLTPREREVLQYLTDAKTVKETASILGLAVNTVDNHKTRLMKKLNVHSCVELTRLAIREGMISF